MQTLPTSLSQNFEREPLKIRIIVRAYGKRQGKASKMPSGNHQTRKPLNALRFNPLNFLIERQRSPPRYDSFRFNLL